MTRELERRVKGLKKHSDNLEAENIRLREIVDGLAETEWPEDWLFTRGQQRILSIIANRGLINRHRLHDLIYWDHPDPPSDKVLDVWICQIRKKLPKGCTIETVWGEGYRMDDASKEMLRPYMTTIS